MFGAGGALFALDHSGVGLPCSCVRMLGGLLITGGEDKIAKVWALAGGGECVASLTHTASVKGVAISQKGFVATTVAGSTGNSLIVWGPAEPPDEALLQA